MGSFNLTLKLLVLFSRRVARLTTN
ncbi:hypothetical protein LINPERHAP1_LOCUS17726 [Linum perenne]